ncbi:MAG: CRTAC1 family protein [Myxococcales bacterium]|nr:CRTAC1 family protein [Myxococcota bacterium]MDW8280279.1 CRTAC1 family protein [Myxococcales bacterium]
MKRLPILLFAPWVCLPLACQAPDETGPLPPQARCRPRAELPPGRLFTDVTDEVGLTGVTGIRLAAADLDGDGWVDLVVHGFGNTRDQVPDRLLRRVLRNRGGRFEDVTMASGLLDSRDGPMTGRLAHLAVFGDVDNDGDLDLFSGTFATATDMPPTDRGEILLNDGRGHFSMAPPSAPSARRLPTAAATFVDYDRDGLLDLFVGHFYLGSEGAGNALYRGLGDGTFEDVSRDSGVLRAPAGGDLTKYLRGEFRRAVYGVTACDVDNDGDADLLTSAYGRAWNELWRNDQGRFTDVGQGTPFAADDLLDYTQDNAFYHCYCRDNPGRCPPNTPAPAIRCDRYAWTPGLDDQPARLAGNTFSTACADLDNDGDLDVVHSEIRHWHIGRSSDPSQILRNLYRETGQLAFERLDHARTGFVRPMLLEAWNEGDISVAVFDFDNDGRKDIYLGSSDYPETWGALFHQQPDGTFVEIARRAGVRHYHAVAMVAIDYDRDGDLDLVVATSTARCGGDPLCPPTQQVRLYRNDVGALRNALQIRLVGGGPGRANRAAIGARVTVRAGGITQVQEVSGGYGHFGLQPGTLLTFGLGEACQADEVEVRWPDAAGSVERYGAIPANHEVELRQGEPRPIYVH